MFNRVSYLTWIFFVGSIHLTSLCVIAFLYEENLCPEVCFGFFAVTFYWPAHVLAVLLWHYGKTRAPFRFRLTALAIVCVAQLLVVLSTTWFMIRGSMPISSCEQTENGRLYLVLSSGLVFIMTSIESVLVCRDLCQVTV